MNGNLLYLNHILSVGGLRNPLIIDINVEVNNAMDYLLLYRIFRWRYCKVWRINLPTR